LLLKLKVVCTFDFGSDDVDVFIVGGGRSEESHPVAVAHSVSVDLCDLVVAAESVSYLQQRSTTNIIAMMYTNNKHHQAICASTATQTQKRISQTNPLSRAVKLMLWANTHLMPKNNGEMTKHTCKKQQMRRFEQIKIISRVMREVIYVSALSRCQRAAECAEKIPTGGVIKVTLFKSKIIASPVLCRLCFAREKNTGPKANRESATSVNHVAYILMYTHAGRNEVMYRVL
jgi:hypothetical protein